MTAVLLDTNAVSDLVRDQTQIKNRLSRQIDPITTSVVVVGEIQYGLGRITAGKKRVDLEARVLQILAAIVIDPVTEPIAQTYGQLKGQLISQGLNLDDNDLWIAASAITE